MKHKGLKKRSIKNWVSSHAEVLAVSFFALSLVTLFFGYHLATRKPQVKGASVSVKEPSNDGSVPFDPTTETGGAQPQNDTGAADSAQSNPAPQPTTPKPTTTSPPNSNQSNSSGSGAGAGNSGPPSPSSSVTFSQDTCSVTATAASGDTLSVTDSTNGQYSTTYQIPSSQPLPENINAPSGDKLAAYVLDATNNIVASANTTSSCTTTPPTNPAN